MAGDKESVKARQERISLEIFQRMASDLRQRPEVKDLPMMRASFERHLTNESCPPERYTEVYEFAVKVYRETDFGKGPFNVYHLLEAWSRIKTREQYDMKHPKRVAADRLLEAPKIEKCKTCAGSKIYVVNGRIQFTSIDGRRRIVQCPDCSEVSDGE